MALTAGYPPGIATEKDRSFHVRFAEVIVKMARR